VAFEWPDFLFSQSEQLFKKLSNSYVWLVKSRPSKKASFVL